MRSSSLPHPWPAPGSAGTASTAQSSPAARSTPGTAAGRRAVQRPEGSSKWWVWGGRTVRAHCCLRPLTNEMLMKAFVVSSRIEPRRACSAAPLSPQHPTHRLMSTTKDWSLALVNRSLRLDDMMNLMPYLLMSNKPSPRPLPAPASVLKCRSTYSEQRQHVTHDDHHTRPCAGSMTTSDFPPRSYLEELPHLPALESRW